MDRRWLAPATWLATRRLAVPGMQELLTLFFQTQQLHVDAGLVPAERAADLERGLAATLF
jgi:hypothetical protein